MNCIHCGKGITLVPSAAERAAKSGQTTEFYTRLFNEHTECALKRRAELTSELIRRINEGNVLPSR